MVNIKYLMEGVSLQFHTVGDEGPLKVTHSAFTFFDTRFQNTYALMGESIDTGRNPLAFAGIIIKAGNIHMVVDSDVERFFVVYEIGNPHQAISTFANRFFEMTYILFKIAFGKNCVDSGETERLGLKYL